MSSQSGGNGLEDGFDDDRQHVQYAPYLPACTPTFIGFKLSNFGYGITRESIVP
jgi:hypothetical protein